jgi:hypothetical protein
MKGNEGNGGTRWAFLGISFTASPIVDILPLIRANSIGKLDESAFLKCCGRPKHA